MKPLPHPPCRPCAFTQDFGRLLRQPESTLYATTCLLPMAPNWVGGQASELTHPLGRVWTWGDGQREVLGKVRLWEAQAGEEMP